MMPTEGAEIRGLRFNSSGFYTLRGSCPVETVDEAYNDPFAEDFARMRRNPTPVVETVDDEDYDEDELILYPACGDEPVRMFDEPVGPLRWKPTPVVETVIEDDDDLPDDISVEDIFLDTFHVTKTYCLDQLHSDPEQWSDGSVRGSVLNGGSTLNHQDWSGLIQAQNALVTSHARILDYEEDDLDEAGLAFLDAEDDQAKVDAAARDLAADDARSCAEKIARSKDFRCAGHSN